MIDNNLLAAAATVRYSTRMRTLAFALLLVAGCSSASSGSSAPPCKLEGTWAIHYNRDSSGGGTCVGGADAFDEVVTITQSASDPGSAQMMFQGADGACVGIVDGCKLTNDCTKVLVAGGQQTRQDSWTFNGDSVGGHTFFAFPLTNGTGNCTYNAVLSGSRK